jgi:hypothetical protein
VAPFNVVMAGHSPSKTGVDALLPGHPRLTGIGTKTWMPGIKPGMTSNIEESKGS